jgi:GalNAc-alpha-(1->4)-GalNAc-alpha-(1->3)-diNAcBac-PP-undecaprenol alpha-1,4-N-acetyl-D-galactosaminyltransferase
VKLLFVIKTLELPGGGAERVLAEVTGALAHRGHEVAILSFDRRGGKSFYPLAPAVRRIGYGIGDISSGTGAGEAARRVAAIRRLAKDERPDVATGFMHSAYIPLGLALIGSNIPVIASEHIAYDHYRSRPLQAALLRLTPFLARAVTVISPAIREGFPAMLRQQMVVIPNPVGMKDGRATDLSGVSGSMKTLLSVGRLEEQKDHRTLIEAFARIAARFPDWRLRIVGEGILRAHLEAQVKRLGLADRVSLPGVTSQIEEEYSAAQLFAMPSSYESFGLATAEALSYGLPVIGFADCPGTNELVRDGVNGLLVEGRDRAAALAEGLATLMGSSARRQELGAAAPASIAEFAPERVADEWEKLLMTIGSRSG